VKVNSLPKSSFSSRTEVGDARGACRKELDEGAPFHRGAKGVGFGGVLAIRQCRTLADTQSRWGENHKIRPRSSIGLHVSLNQSIAS